MASRAPILGVTTIAAFAAIAIAFLPKPRGGSAGGSAPPRAPAEASQAPIVVPAKRVNPAYSLLGEYYGRELTPDAKNNSTQKLPVSSFDVLIATAPDPYDTHLDASYDAFSDAIRRAYEEAGFIIDRFWIPGRQDVFDARPARDVLPGVMLFRHKSDTNTDNLRVLYIVGEVPTSGVQKEALRKAFEERDALLADARFNTHTVGRDSVKIVGPYFSGSARSMRLVIDEHYFAQPGRVGGKPPYVRMISGSATSSSNALVLNARDSISFSATVHPDEVLIREATDALTKLGVDPSQVVLLRETTTQYGVSQDNIAAAGEEIDSSSAARTLAGVTVIPFPLNIATLRSAFSDYPDPLAASGRPAAQAQPRVPLNLQHRGGAREAPAVTSPVTPASLELALNQISLTLRREQIKAVGILATDVLDRLFLADFVKQRMPDVQLFTFGTHDLLLRDDYEQVLRGSLVFSAYPLTLDEQRWEEHGVNTATGSSERLTFSNESAQGTFNAALVQLGAPAALKDYAMVGSRRAPLIWTVAIGNNAFYPLNAKAPAENERSLEFAGPPEEALPLPASKLIAAGQFAVGGSLGLVLFALLISVRLALAEWVGGKRTALAIAHVRREQRTASTGHEQIVFVPGHKEMHTFWTNLQKVLDRGIISSRRMLERVGIQRIAQVHRDSAYESVETAALAAHRALYANVLTIAIGLGAAPPALLLLSVMPGSGVPQMFGVSTACWIAATVLLTGFMLIRYATYWVELTRFFFASDWQNRLRGELQRGLEIVGRMCVSLFMLAFVYAGGRYLYFLTHPAPTCTQPTVLCDRGFRDTFYRTMDPYSGLSTLLPFQLIAALVALWCYWNVQRIQKLEAATMFERAAIGHVGERVRRRKEDKVAGSLRAVEGPIMRVRDSLMFLAPNRWSRYVFAALALMIFWTYTNFGRSIEVLTPDPGGSVGFLQVWPQFRGFDFVFRIGLLAAFVIVAWAVLRILLVWRAFSEVLTRIADTPLSNTFLQLREAMPHMEQGSLFSSSNMERMRAFCDRKWSRLRAYYRDGDVVRNDATLFLGEHDRKALDVGFQSERWATRRLKGARQRSDVVRALSRFLDAYWASENFPKYVKSAPSGGDQDPERRRGHMPKRARRAPASVNPHADKLRAWTNEIHEFVAVQCIDYVRETQDTLRRLAMFLLASVLLTTALVSSYSYRPQGLIEIIFIALLLITIGALVYLNLELNRNELLSTLTNTTPGQVDWSAGFVLRIVTIVVIPIVAVLSSHVPALRVVLFSWIDPMMQTLVKF